MAFNRDLSQLANFLEINSDGTFVNIIPSTSQTNLGIGTNNPTAKLDVLGNARVSGNLSAGNINASGIVTATSGFVGALTGLASSATQLATGRTIAITGDLAYTSGVFDGTGNVTGTGTLANTTVTAGSYGSSTEVATFTVDSKGRLTAAGTASVGTALTVAGDSGSENISLLSEVLTISGGTNLNSSAASNTLTVNLDNNISLTSVVASGIITATSGFVGNVTGTATSTTNIPNLTGDITSNNLTTTLATVNSNVGSFGSQTLIPVVTVNAKGLVTSVTTAAVGTALTVSGDSGSENIDLLSEVLTISGGTNLTSSAASNTVTVNLDPNISLTSVVASGIVTAAQFVTGASGSAIGISTNTISGPATITIDPAAVGDNTGLVVIKGDLQIDGTTTTINSTTVTIDDKNIQIADGAANDAAADGAGITITSGDGNKTFQFQDAGDNLGSSENLNVASGKVYKVNNTEVLSNNTLGSGVVNSSLTSVGTLTNLSVGNVNSTGIITATTFVGALTGTASSTTNIPNLTGAITSNNTTTSLGSFSSSNLATALTDKTGTGVAVFATSPTLVTPALGNATATSISVGSTSVYGTVTTTQFAAVFAKATNANATSLMQVKGNDGTTGMGMKAQTGANSLIYSNNNIEFYLGATIRDDDVPSGGTLIATIGSTGLTVPNISASGIITATSGFVGNLTGLASSATQLQTSRDFSISGDATASSISFNGTANVGLALTLANTAVTPGSYGSSTEVPTFTVDSKGRLTAAGTASVGTALTVAGDSGSENINLLNEILTISGGTNLTSSAASNTVTVNLDPNISLTSVVASGIVTATSGFVGSLTGNVTGNINSSGVSTVTSLNATNINASGIITATSGFVGNLTGTATSTTNIPNLTGDITSVNTATTLATVNSNVGSFGSQTLIPVVTVNAKGLVTSVTTAAVGTALTVTGDSGSENIDLLSEVLTISGGTNLTSSAASNTVTVNLDPNISLTSVVASGIITATSGFVGNITGNLTGDINSSGVSTVTSLIATNINASGIVTAAQFVTGASGSAIGINTNTISGPATITIDPAGVGDNTGAVRIKGDLFVDGTQFIVNSTTIELADFIVGIASTATTDILADGAGIKIGPDNTLTYDHTNTALKSSENFNLASGKTYKINGTDVLSNNTLGSGVVNSSLTSVGTLTNLNVGNVNSTGIITATTFVGALTGNVTGNINSSGVSTVTSLNATNINVSGIVTATSGFVGNVTGTATSTTNIPNLTGDITSVNTATTLATVNSNVGSFGSQTLIPVVTVNAKGLVTSVTTAAVGSGLTVSGDSGSENIDLLTETLTISGGTNLTSSAASNTVTVNLDPNISLTSVVASGVITATSGFVGNLTGNINSSGVSTVTNLNIGGYISIGNTTGTANQVLASVGAGVTWKNFNDILPQTRTTQTFVATAGQTSFNFVYNVNFLDVFVNGVKLSSGEFTASNGTSITLSEAAFVNDTVEFVSYATLGAGTGQVSSLNDLTDVTLSGIATGNLLAYNGSEFVNTSNINVTGIITATSFVGDGSGLTGAGSTVANDVSTNGTFYPVLTQTTTGTITSSKVSTTKLSFNPSTGTLSATSAVVGTAVTINSSGLNVTGVITATSFVGDGSGLTGAGSTVADDTTTNQSFFPVLTQTTSGIITASKVSSTKLVFNPSSGALSATDFNSTSDINLKENIRQVESASELVSKLEGVHFSWKETGKETIGVIAQQIEEHLPQLVQTGDTHKTVNYNGLIGVLIEAVKEQGAQIAALQAEIEELKK